MQAQRLPVIDLLRGVAILMVIWHHLWGYSHFSYGGWLTYPFPLDVLALLARHGWIAVNLFFILSGFVLFLPYARGGRALDRAGIKQFFIRRIQRLLPLYIVVALAVCLWGAYSLTLLADNPDRAGLMREMIAGVATLTYPFLSPTSFEPLLHPSLWSIGVEIWFTPLFPLLALLLLKAERPGRSVKIAAVFVMAFLLRLWGYCHPQWAPYFPHDPHQLMANSVPAMMDSFMTGMVIAYGYTRGWRLKGSWPLWSLLAVSAILAALIIYDTALLGAWPLALLALPDTLLQLGFGIILLLALQRERPLPRITLPLQLAGMMSYSLYVWQHPAIIYTLDYGVNAASALLCLLYIGALAWVTYRHVEFRQVKDWRALLPTAA